MDLISFLAEIRLKEKEGTQMTSVKINESENLTVPIWVTKANWPLGNLTCEETTAVIVVNDGWNWPYDQWHLCWWSKAVYDDILMQEWKLKMNKRIIQCRGKKSTCHLWEKVILVRGTTYLMNSKWRIIWSITLMNLQATKKLYVVRSFPLLICNTISS